MKQILIIILLGSFALTSCKTKEVNKSDEVIQVAKETEQLKENITLIGHIKKQGVTTYQYGSHILKTADKFFALRSETIDLKSLEGQEVKIIAEKIKGYPLSGGPEFLLVKSVELVK